MPTSLVGRNKDMIFARVRGLIKGIEERGIPSTPVRFIRLTIDSQRSILDEIILDIQRGEKNVARDRIVTLMSEEKGIAGWATALRMAVENLIL